MDKKDVDKALKNAGLKITDEYTIFSKKYNMIDENGYKYYMNIFNLVNANSYPLMVYKSNPYSVDNINQYFKNNNIDCKCLSKKYLNNKEKLLFQCSCGNLFYKDWTHIRRGQITCNACSDKRIQEAKTYPKEEIFKSLENKGLLPIDSTYTCISNGLYCFTIDGYIVHANKLTLYNDSFPEIIHPDNPYTIYNINRYFDLYRNGEYVCLEKEYISNTYRMLFKHMKCGTIFESNWANMRNNSSPSTCPFCEKGRYESYHACVLKQVFKHMYPDVSLEDPSCINPSTNTIMSTDIVHHKLKIAIEIQSAYHDKQEQRNRDEIKKNYWLSRDYKYYQLDIRDYSVLEMIQVFFPKIISIPSYIINNYEDTDKYIKAQELIDSRKYTNVQIANLLNVSVQSLYYWNNQNKINLSK